MLELFYPDDSVLLRLFFVVGETGQCSGVTWERFYYNSLSAYNTLVDLVVALVT